jgi:hypothetical protein
LLHLVGVDLSPRISGHLTNGLNQDLPVTLPISKGFRINVFKEIKSTMKAIVAQGRGLVSIVEVPKPVVPGAGWVLVKVEAIAINLTDWKHIDYRWTNAGYRVGCDYSGVVEEVGSKFTKFTKGFSVVVDYQVTGLPSG